MATSTGQYLILFSTVASCTIYFVYGTLDWQYGLWVAAWCALAAQILLYFINLVVKRFKRQSIILVFLTGLLVLTVIMVPTFGGLDAQKSLDEGKDIWALSSFC